jgi:hypothetical protein
MLLGHGSTFDRPNSLPAQGEVQESQSPGTSQALASETWSRIQDERIWVLNLSLRSQSFETSEISVPRPSRNLNFETFSRSQFRDLLEIPISRPSRNPNFETFSKSQFRDLLEISVPRPSRDLNPETLSKSQFRDLLEISVPRPSRDLSLKTFLRSQFRDLLEISTRIQNSNANNQIIS